MKMVCVPRSWRTDNSADDFRPFAKPFRESMKEPRVVLIAAAAWAPVAAKPDPKAAPQMPRHFFRPSLVPPKRTKIKARQVECVAKRVLADSARSAARSAAIVAASVSQPSRGPPVVFDCQFHHKCIELRQPFGEIRMDLGAVAQGFTAVTHQGFPFAFQALSLFEETLHLVERMFILGKAVEEREVVDGRLLSVGCASSLGKQPPRRHDPQGSASTQTCPQTLQLPMAHTSA